MKTFLWENKPGLIFLGIPVLCWIILSNINLYQIKYDRTPWVELGAPPAPVTSILQVGFAKVASNKPNPAIYVLDKDINTYRCCSVDGWQKTKDPTYSFPAYAFTEEQRKEKRGTPYCGLKIEKEWQLKQESEQGITRSDSYGICDTVDSYEYAVIQFKEDGTIREKYVAGEGIYILKEKLPSFFISWLSIVVLAAVASLIKRNWQDLKIHWRESKMGPQDLKKRWRENKTGGLVLGIPVLCLVILWNVNIYRIWYDNTPWVKIDSPPSEVTRFNYVSFPYITGRTPEISIYAEDKKVYYMNWMGQWDSGRYPDYWQLRHTISPEESACVTKIQNAWWLDDEQDHSAHLIYTRGSCAFYSFDSDQYLVLKVAQNGDIWEKYVDSENPRQIRKWITFSICLFLGMASPFWINLFIDFDFLKLKPDYSAN